MRARLALAFAALMLLPTLAPGAVAERGPPFVPDDTLPEAVEPTVNGTYHTVINTFANHAGVAPVLFHEGFEGPATLEERGWKEEILGHGHRAVPSWNLGKVNATQRAQGLPTAIVAEGEGSATIAGETGAYAPQRESRLVTPLIDLRWALGASSTTGGPYDQPTFNDLAITARDTLADRLASGQNPDLAIPARELTKTPAERGIMDEREGLGLVNLTFFHAWDLANGDHAWLDVRVLGDDGTWGAWEPLQGDLVYETEIDYGTLYKLSAYCELVRESRGSSTAALRGPSAANSYCRPGGRLSSEVVTDLVGGGTTIPCGPGCQRQLIRFGNLGLGDEGRVGPQLTEGNVAMPALSGSASHLLDYALNGGTYPPAYYNGARENPDGTSTRTWVDASTSASGDVVVRKAHFTLNRFIGKQVQIGFHALSQGLAEDQFGWYVDEVEVTAAVPDRDPAVNSVKHPEAGDVLAADTRVRPVVLLANNGRFALRDLNVTIRLTDLSETRTLLTETVPVPYLGPVERRLVSTDELSDPLPVGAYRVHATVAMPSASGDPAIQPDADPPVQVDARPDNNNITVDFAVRSVLDVRARIEVPADAVMTELDEAKAGIRVVVANVGNVNTTGVLNVTLHRLDPETGNAGPALEVLASDTLLAAEFPYGKAYTATGSSANEAVRSVSWTGHERGIYQVQARFLDASGRVFEAFPQNVFVRQTPTSALALNFSYDPDDATFHDFRPNDPSQLCLDAAAKNCFQTFGWAVENVDANDCGSKTGADSVREAPMCPLPRTAGGLGAPEGEWVWVATHNDDLARPTDAVFGTNVFDEGILEHVQTIRGLPSKNDRLYLAFRQFGQFNWATPDDNLADPNGFRGQLRVLLENSKPGGGTAPDAPQRVDDADSRAAAEDAAEGAAPDAPGTPEDRLQDRVLVVVNFTTPADWRREVVDITAATTGLAPGQARTVAIQWVAQSTPADVVPNWRRGGGQRDARPTGETGGGNFNVQPSATSECTTTGLTAVGACTLFDPTPMWAIDAIELFPAPPSPNPVAVAERLWHHEAEPNYTANPRGSLRQVTGNFTDCQANIVNEDDPDPSRRGTNAPMGYHRADFTANSALNDTAGAPGRTSPVEKCRGWRVYKAFPYPTLWHFESTKDRGPPSTSGVDETLWLRWGNVDGLLEDASDAHPGGGSEITSSWRKGFYSVARTPRFSLQGTQQPAATFDHWHRFVSETKTLTDPEDISKSYEHAMEGGNVWISGYDALGRRVLHEILFPAPSSAAQYTHTVPHYNSVAPGQPADADVEFPVFDGVEPEWSENYTRLRGTKVAFAKSSGSGALPEWVPVRFDLSRYASEDLRDLAYSLEFHAFMWGASGEVSAGWRIDNLQVREGQVANDVALADVESPGAFAGPGVEQPVVIRVRNDGVFPQRGVHVQYTVFDANGEPVHGPIQGRIPYGGPGDEIPGIRDAERPDKNVTFPFNVSWTPGQPGVYTLEARVNLSRAVEPYLDENLANDVFRRTIVVKEHHDIFLHGASTLPDDAVVTPAIGAVGKPRSIALVVENQGTVPERYVGAEENDFRVEVDIVGEDGKSVLPAPLRQNLREVAPGQKVAVAFPDAWVPTRSGVYRVLASLHYPGDKDDASDNARVVKHLVFDQLVPAPGANLTTEFAPDDLESWGHNATRYATVDGWSFPPDLEYAPSLDSSLVLERVLNLRAVRSAFISLNHSFDFEESYDGARVEASLDGGRTWQAIPPRQDGGWTRMSTASPFVEDPNDVEYAFTGQGQGTWEFNLGAIEELVAETSLLDDDFEGRGRPQLRANLTLREPRPLPPTALGFSATFEPSVDPRDDGLVLVEVRGADRAGDVVVDRVQVSADGGSWADMRRSGDLWSLDFPRVHGVTPKPKDADNDIELEPVFPGTLLRFRAYAAGDTTDTDPYQSVVYRLEPGASIEALPAAREQVFRYDPGQNVLWSDKTAVLCRPGVTTVSVRTCGGFTSTHAPDQLAEGEALTSVKWLKTTLDLTAARPGSGALRIDLRDAAAVPPVVRAVGTSRPPMDSYVRLTIDLPETPEKDDIVRDGMLADPQNPDRYWNWTDRVVVVQGTDWDRIAGKTVDLRLEHIVSAATSKDSGAYHSALPSARDTDEYGPHFGYGIAYVKAEAQGEGLAGVVRLRELDPAQFDPALPLAQNLANAQWDQGVDSRHYNVAGNPGAWTSQAYAPPDVWTLTDEPMRDDTWRQASRWEPSRPVDSDALARVGRAGFVNHYWEANASRPEFAMNGGAGRLVMPVDLKPVVGEATLAFNTQFLFHRAQTGFSGFQGTSSGRVEVSVDDGITWIPLTPIDHRRTAIPLTPHPGQVLPDGTPFFDVASARYGTTFASSNIGTTANRFVEDRHLAVGRPHEFGSSERGIGFQNYTTPVSPYRYVGNGTHKIAPWVSVAFDLTPYAGRDVLVGFHAQFTTHDLAASPLGWGSVKAPNTVLATASNFWRIDDVKVLGEVFEGGDVRVRLRATTDGTVAATGWDVREFEVVSQKHFLNSAARVVSPTSGEPLRLGDNPFVVEVLNRGVVPLEGTRVAVYLNATGSGAPPSVNWTGTLREFDGCPGESVPPDDVLRPDRSVRLCGSLTSPFVLVGAPDAEYELTVLVEHDDVLAETLVGDNVDVRRFSGDDVVRQDQVRATGLVALPSTLDPKEDRDVVVTADLELVGFERADVAEATLEILGDLDHPVSLTLADAESFAPKFDTPGEERELTWRIPASTWRTLRDGLLSAEVTVRTAGVAEASTIDTPLYKGSEIRPSPGFVFKDAFEMFDSQTQVLTHSLGYDAGGVVDTSSMDVGGNFRRSTGCRDDTRQGAREWCVYHTAWYEGRAAPLPDPSQDDGPGASCSDGGDHWTVEGAADAGDAAAQAVPSVRERANVLDLDGFKNPSSCLPTGQGQATVIAYRPRAISAQSPPIDVRGMKGAGEVPRVGLQFLQRYNFGAEGAFGKVFVAPWHLRDADQNNAFGNPIQVGPGENEWIEVARLDGSTRNYGEYLFEPYSLDLGGAIAANNTRGLDFDYIKVRFVLYLPPQASFVGWQVDDVLVTPFAAELGPAQSFPLNDDTDKTYTYELVNGGAFSDVYNVTLRRGDGSRIQLPGGWNVTVLDEDGSVLDQMGPTPAASAHCAPATGARKEFLELGAGESRTISVKVCIPVTSGTPGRTGFAPIEISAFSQKVKGQVAPTKLDLDYAYMNRANLKVASVRTGGDAPVGQPRQITVEVHNTGTLAACQAVVRLVDELPGEPPTEVFATNGRSPDVGQCRKRPDGVFEGGLPPGEGRQFRFVWTPRNVGTHNLTAVVDATGLVSELSEDDNRVTVPVVVSLPSYPDVAARVAVSDEEPNIGDAVTVSLALTNIGGVAAQSVNVTMKMGVTDLLGRGALNEGLVPRIDPGETVWINKTWRAVFPGRVLLYVNALPRDGVLERVETQANNLVVKPLFVRSQGLDVTAKEVGAVADAGRAVEAGFIVSNNGDTPDAYDLAVDAPRGVRTSIFLGGSKVDSLVLSNRTSANITVVFELPDRFPAGDTVVGLRALSQNTSQERVAQFVLGVRARYGLFLEAAQHESPPGRVEVPLALTNLGNARDALVVDALDAPAGWKSVPTNATVDPYGRTTVPLVLHVPTTTSRGLYEVLARVRDAAGFEATAVVGVTVLDYQSAVPAFETPTTVVRPESQVATAVALVNEGNVRAETRLVAEAPDGWTVEVARPVLVLAPGERADVPVRVVVPADAPFGTKGEVRLRATSGATERTGTFTVEVAESDLHVLELDHAPRVGVAEGQEVSFTAVVRNDGKVEARDVAVAFYVDDLLAGHETIEELAAGGERTVSFRWTATGGEHVVLAILDPGDTVREVDEANNARLEIVRVGRDVGILSAAREDVPAPAVALTVVAAIAAVLVRGRKRTR